WPALAAGPVVTVRPVASVEELDTCWTALAWLHEEARLHRRLVRWRHPIGCGRHLASELQARPQGIVDYSPAVRRLDSRTARALAGAWRRRSNTSGSVTLRRVRMLAAAAVVDR